MSGRIPSPYQATLLPPVARASDPATSHNAARAIEPKRGTRMSEVLGLLRAHPRGLTAQEVERFLSYRDVTTGKMVTGWWKRLSDLKAAKLVRATGEERDGGEVYVAVTP
jgi:hypothetical protein